MKTLRHRVLSTEYRYREVLKYLSAVDSYREYSVQTVRLPIQSEWRQGVELVVACRLRGCWSVRPAY